MHIYGPVELVKLTANRPTVYWSHINFTVLHSACISETDWEEPGPCLSPPPYILPQNIIIIIIIIMITSIA